jgi:asparagine synthase (glutamine-hydrolysing)
MCAIIGINSVDKAFNWELLTRGRDAMRHRGPDDGGVWLSESIGLAHRRLSILDLTSGGHQPMLSSDGNVAIVFNGEIYNYQELRTELETKGEIFKSQSDTEVLLRSYLVWGFDCVRRLNGMFAFAIYDRTKNNIFLARDRVGEKPLFYYQDQTSFRFASELKAILVDGKVSRKISWESMEHYLAFGYVPDALCILSGFHKLSAGHALVFNLQSRETKVWRYWNPPKYVGGGASLEVLQEEFHHLFGAAVRQQLSADVPVGVLLSGGVDSSLVAAFAAKECRSLKTFSVVFPGNPDYDESKYSKIVADYLGADHTVVPVRDFNSCIIDKLAEQFDEPIGDSSMLPTYWVSNAVRQKCTVALGGDGADELFGGYKRYSRILKLERVRKMLPRLFRKIIGATASMALPIGIRGRRQFQYLGDEVNQFQYAAYFEEDLSRKILFNERGRGLQIHRQSENPIAANASDLLQLITRYDFQRYLCDDILVKVDRASMLNSLEVRSPFLDINVVEFALNSIPSEYKANEREQKILLKAICNQIFPKTFDVSRKKGFSIPIDLWMSEKQSFKVFREILLDPSCCFSQTIVNKLFSRLGQRYNNGERLFALGVFEMWRRKYDAAFEL